MQLISLEEINNMDETQILRALNTNKIKVNDVDKAMLILEKFKNSRSTRPLIESKCIHLEEFVKDYKFQ